MFHLHTEYFSPQKTKDKLYSACDSGDYLQCGLLRYIKSYYVIKRLETCCSLLTLIGLGAVLSFGGLISIYFMYFNRWCQTMTNNLSSGQCVKIRFGRKVV